MSAAGSHKRPKQDLDKHSSSDDSLSNSSFKSSKSSAKDRWHATTKKQKKSETLSVDLDELDDEEQ